MKRLLGIILTILLISSCGVNKKDIDTGRLEYKITYLETTEGGFDPSLLPKKMVLEFNPENCINIIQGFMGVFQLSTFVEFGKKKTKTHLKVFGENYFYEGDKNELMCCFDAMEEAEYSFDTTTKVIAGLKSKKATITFPDSDRTFDIYYTNDIYLPNANANNPYYFIDGVLTSFQLTSSGYTMQFDAAKYLPGAPAKYKFAPPENHKAVNKNELNYIFSRLLSSK